MKKGKIHIWLLVCILSFSGFFLSYGKILAASATIYLTEPKEIVKSGETFTVIVVVQSSEEIGNVEAFVSFDKEMASFQSGGLFATGGDGIVMIRDWDTSQESTRKKYPLTFKAKKDGECKFEISKDASVYHASSEESMSVSCVNLALQIGEIKRSEPDPIENPEVKENTTEKGIYPTLETLTMSDGILAPLFEPKTYQYKTEVDSTVENLEISAIPENKGDTVTIKGNEDLKEGKNKVTIILTSSLGRERTYTIEVIKNSKENDVSKHETEDGSIYCTKEDEELTLTQTLKLTIKTPNKSIIPMGYDRTNLRIDGVSIPAYMKAEDMKADTYLIYGVDGKGNAGFYQYNRLTKTITPIGKEVENKNTSSNTEDTTETNFQLIIVIILLGIICTVLSVILALQLLKKPQPVVEDDNLFDHWKH